jgi:transcription termination/antitermination protein NusA
MKLDLEKIQLINIFEKITRAKVVEHIDENTFIIEEGDLRKALGKNNFNLKKIENLLKKKIRLVEFNKNPEKFLKNITYPLTLKSVNVGNDKVVIQADTKTKGLLIGRNHKKLEILKDLFKRHFKLEIIIK